MIDKIIKTGSFHYGLTRVPYPIKSKKHRWILPVVLLGLVAVGVCIYCFAPITLS